MIDRYTVSPAVWSSVSEDGTPSGCPYLVDHGLSKVLWSAAGRGWVAAVAKIGGTDAHFNNSGLVDVGDLGILGARWTDGGGGGLDAGVGLLGALAIRRRRAA